MRKNNLQCIISNFWKSNSLQNMNINQKQDKQIFYLIIICFTLLFTCNYAGFTQAKSEVSLKLLTPHEFYFNPIVTQLVDKASNSFPEPLLYFICLVVIPILTWIFLNKIFERFITHRYAALFALLSVSFYHEYSLRQFILDIATFNIQGLCTPKILVISYFPLPSLSILSFLLIFKYLVILRIRSIKIDCTQSILCGLYFYVSAVDAIFLILMIILTYIIQFINNKSLSSLILQVGILGIIMSPGIYSFTPNVENTDYSINKYNLILYNILPLVLAITFFYVKRIDPYEVWYKFKFVYLLLLSEIFLNLIIILGIVELNTEILNRQILHFFAHFLYYTPMIYYGSVKQKKFHFGSESTKKAQAFSDLVYYIIAKSEKKLQLTLFIILLLYHFPCHFFITNYEMFKL